MGKLLLWTTYHSLVVAAVVVPGTWYLLWSYHPEEFLDREKPYARVSEESRIVPVSPTECGLPDGPVPVVVQWDGCNRVEWKVNFYKSCRASRRNADVRRVLFDKTGKEWGLPTIRSQFADRPVTIASYMSKTFIQPRSPGGLTRYKADVCYECPTEHWKVNPVHKIIPVCVTDGEIRYDVVEAL